MVKRFEIEVTGINMYRHAEIIDGSYVEYRDYATLKAERDALGAECAIMKSCIDAWCDMPATDAFLAEVRAQGVESGVKTIIAMMNHQNDAVVQAINILQHHAAQLRKEAK